MTTDESDGKPAKRGKPDRGIRGRPTTTVRFTAARLADLRQDAAMIGRSVSEEVEIRIEAYARHEAAMQEVLGRLSAAQQEIGSLQQERRALREELEEVLREKAGKGSIAMDDERAARIAAAAIAAFVDGRKK